MTSCNATILVGEHETLTCCLTLPEHRSDDDYAHEAEEHFVRWTDGAPGATPHKDPTPDLHIYCRAAERAREREAEDHRVRANENFDEAMHWRSEADRYRKALLKIAHTSPSQAVVPARLYACRVLDGGQP